MESWKIKVYGKVQGVYFRASTRQKAFELGISGVVKNETDGSVYIEAEGSEKALKHFIAWCNQGPPGAVVDKLEKEEIEPRHFTTFEVKY